MSGDREQTKKIVHVLLDELLEVFDGLRAELVDSLVDYEGRLRGFELPPWLESEHLDLVDLFTTDEGELIGPRQVALAAAEVEAFVKRWVGDHHEAVVVDFDGPAINLYRAECAELEQTFQYFEESARTVGAEVVEQLGRWLEQILEELQHTRDEDEHALRGLISDGSLSKDASQQEEIAALWEDYRVQAQELTTCWDSLEALGFEGVDQTINGLQELREIVTDTDLALAQIYPALAVDFEPFEVPQRPDEDRETLDLNRDDDDVATNNAADERRTTELNREIEKTLDASRPEIFDALPDRKPEPETGSGTEPGSKPETGSETEPSDDRAAATAEGSALAPVKAEYRASRTVLLRDPIPGIEIVAVWGIAGGFLFVVLIAAAAFTLGASASNPFERFGGLWSACLVAGAALVIGPIVRQWRIDDPGTGKPRIVRFRESIETLEVVRYSDTVKLGAHLLTSDGAPKLQRWERMTPPSFGWMFKKDRTTLYCVEKNVTRWEDSRRTQLELPDDAWEISLDQFWEVCAALEVST